MARAINYGRSEMQGIGRLVITGAPKTYYLRRSIRIPVGVGLDLGTKFVVEPCPTTKNCADQIDFP
jgi:hypothetical protein